MKWIMLTLLLLNLLFYLVGSGYNAVVAPLNVTTNSDINHDGVRLLSEVHVAHSLPSHNLSRTHRGSWCHRIGPFAEKNDLLSVKKWMNSQQLTYDTVNSAPREIQVTSVYIGPFDSLAAVEPIVAYLVEAGIEYLVDSAQPSAIRISLGYFTQEQLASQFIAHFAQRDINAKAESEYHTMQPLSWLEVSGDTANRDTLRFHRFPESGVVLREIDCHEMVRAAKG